MLTVPTSHRRTTVSKLCAITNKDMFSNILDEFKDITTPRIRGCHLQGRVEHHIDTHGSRPVFARARRLAPDKLAVAKEEFSRLLDMNIVRSSNSPCSSPLHTVPKPSGGWRELMAITERVMQFQRMIDAQYLTCKILFCSEPYRDACLLESGSGSGL